MRTPPSQAPRSRRSAAHVVGVLVAVASVVLGACSTPVSLDDYIEAMESASEAYVTEAQDRSFQYQSTVEDGVRDLVAADAGDPLVAATGLVRTETVRYLAHLGDAMDRYRDALAGTRAPSEVAEAHEAFVAAVGAIVDGIPETRRAVESSGSLDDVERALGGSRLADGQPRWTATCRALEQAVRDQGRGIDLRCVEDATP